MEAVEAREKAEQGKSKEQKEEDQDEVCLLAFTATLYLLYLGCLFQTPKMLPQCSSTTFVRFCSTNCY